MKKKQFNEKIIKLFKKMQLQSKTEQKKKQFKIKKIKNIPRENKT